MGLGSAPVIAFVATSDAGEAREFYANTLGLRLVGEESGQALVFAIGDEDTLRVTILAEHVPPPHSVLGWKVDDIAGEVDSLMSNGVTFERFEMFSQDDLGICTFPNGDRVAWFKDPAGNMLSLTQPA